MFRKISSAAADAHSFSSPFTRPPKPTPLNSRNSTSFLQMFRKFSSAAAAAAAAHSFSSQASPPNGKLSSLFTRPPKPAPLNSTNSRSLSTYAENLHDKPKIGVSTARLKKFLQTDCKSGDVSADEAFGFFHRMVEMEPKFPLYSFNLLLNGLAKNKRYHDEVLLLFGKMNSGGLIPNFVTLNILLKNSCNANRVSDAFLVMGRILRMGYSPTMVTFNSLIKGLCMGTRVDDAAQLYLTLEKFSCRPNVNSWRTLNLGLRLCGMGNTGNALKFHEENVSGNGEYSSVRWCEPEPEPEPDDVVSYGCFIIDGYCQSGMEYDALKIFSQMKAWGWSRDARVYNCIMNGFCCAGKWEVALSLLEDMLDQEIPFDGKTFYVLIDIFCQIGDMELIKWILDWMIEYGIDLRSQAL